MKVLVTGGTGNVGTAAVSRLAASGHDVRVAALDRGGERDGVEYHRCDVTDYGQLRPLAAECDAIVHLAATNHPIGTAGHRVFGVNACATFNVFEAAAEAGVERVIAASSINALGFYFGDRSFALPYLPVDEDVPGCATDAYSFSKQISERIADYFFERDGIDSVSLRLPAVLRHDRVLAGGDRIDAETGPLIEELLATPERDRAARLDRLHEAYDRFRRAHRLDKRNDANFTPEELRAFDLSPAEYSFMKRKADFFAYVDELDSAQAIERALTARLEGSHPLYISAARNRTGYPPAELAKLYRPAIPEIRGQTPGDDCLISIDRARSLIGFDPQWTV